MIEIVHRNTKAALYRSETAATVKEAVIEAMKSGSDLSGSDLRGSDLSYCDLRGSDLSYCDLRGSDLSYCDLRGSDLSGSDLSGSDLRGSDLRGSDLSGSDLSGSDLSGSDLRGSDLSGSDLSVSDLSDSDLRDSDLRGSNLRYCDLSYCDLSGSDLSGSDLSGSKDLPAITAAQASITPDGVLIGWKQCNGGVIVKLQIPADAKRSNATGRKCRCQFADVLEVIGEEVGLSQHDAKTEYRVGHRVTCDAWCDDRWQECAGGIHFFITRAEAEAY